MPSAAILSGGGATRYAGRDKGTLLVQGRSIRDRQLAELAAVTDDIMIVGASPGPTVTDPLVQIRLVADRIHGYGPLGGLDAALAAADHDQLIVIACDMPFVTAPLLRHLLTLTRDADAVVPRTEDGYHPLCAAYTRACRGVVTRRLAQNRLAMAGILDEVRTRVVTTSELKAFGDPARLLANVNTPAALEAIEALLSHET